MSLINDALKRTKEAQQQAQPPAGGGPELKPVDPAVAKAASSSKTLLYIMVACVVVGNLFLFLYAFNGDRTARPAPMSAAQPVAPPTTAAAPARPVPAVTTPAMVAPATPAVAPIAAAPVNPASAQPSAAVETNAAVAAIAAPVAPEPPKPAPLKLQSIMFNSTKPAAMVSGKFVNLGDKVQGFRVTAIDQETVTLVGNGQTNVLSLP
jgi:hypothetical protein